MIKTHKAGMEHIRSLIEHGKVSDKPFSFDAEDRDELLGPKGTHIEEYARHHLGEDDSGEEGDHRRYRYPCAKEGRCYSRALKSICDRAKEHGHDEVRTSAEELLALTEEGNAGDTTVESKSATPAKETRCLMAGLELRAAPQGTDSPGTLVGYAAVYNLLSEDLGGFREVIRPGAFRDIIGTDVRGLVNHSDEHLIGRVKSGTLRLVDTPLGLKDEIDLPSTHIGRDTAESVRRGDMDGQSFSFRVRSGDPDDVEWIWDTNPPTRVIKRVEAVYDVGPVTRPAYTETSVALRSLEQARPRPSDPTPPRMSSPGSMASTWARQLLTEAALPPPSSGQWSVVSGQ